MNDFIKRKWACETGDGSSVSISRRDNAVFVETNARDDLGVTVRLDAATAAHVGAILLQFADDAGREAEMPRGARVTQMCGED